MTTILRTRHLMASVAPLLCALALLGGCSSMAERERETRLDDTLRAYEKGIRWGEFGMAVALIKPRKVLPRPVTRRDLEAYRITGYEIVSRTPAGDDGMEIDLVVEIGAYDINRGVVFAIEDLQRWYFDVNANSWFLDGTLPNLNAR